MGIDVKKISPIEDVKIIRMDVTNDEFQNEIDFYFHDKLDLILSDASINKTGNKFSDQIRQINLCYKIFEIIKKNLKFKGCCVIKAFQGQDLNDFYKAMKKQFLFLKQYNPKSSRKGSNEIYIIGQKKK